MAQVASGILLSRITGLLREKIAAHYLGVSAFSDVFAAVFRGPNLLQNLLGEQSLSASFIPVYAGKLGEGKEEEASRFAAAIFGLLLALASLVALVGVVFAGPLVALLSSGMLRDAALVEAGLRTVDRYPLAVTGVRIIFPMTAILVLSAWCLGILNSHRRFFLSYCAPAFWSAAIITGFLWAGRDLVGNRLSLESGERLLVSACVGALVGAVLQLGIQLPVVWRLLAGFRPRFSLAVDGVREALSRFGPAVIGRSAAQLSGYIDLFLASFLTVGTLAALGWAQRLYLLPIALFGFSVAAVELPELSRLDPGKRAAAVPGRFSTAFGRAFFFVGPTLVLFLVFGYLVVALLYRGGNFGSADNWLVYLVLAVYTLGLPSTVISRLLQNIFFAVGDTKTPARVAFVRLGISASVGAAVSLLLDRVSLEALLPIAGAEAHSLAPLGLAIASVLGSWFELGLLRRRLDPALSVELPWHLVVRPVLTALLAAAPCGFLWWALRSRPTQLQALVVLCVFSLVYLALSPERARLALGGIGRRGGSGS